MVTDVGFKSFYHEKETNQMNARTLGSIDFYRSVEMYDFTIRFNVDRCVVNFVCAFE